MREKIFKQKINYKTHHFGFAIVAVIALAAAGCSLFGVGTLDKTTVAVKKDVKGLALQGFDAVAYFKENLPREGKSEFTAESAAIEIVNLRWSSLNGTKTLFSSIIFSC